MELFNPYTTKNKKNELAQEFNIDPSIIELLLQREYQQKKKLTSFSSFVRRLA